jgi:hypothetical protein
MSKQWNLKNDGKFSGESSKIAWVPYLVHVQAIMDVDKSFYLQDPVEDP